LEFALVLVTSPNSHNTVKGLPARVRAIANSLTKKQNARLVMNKTRTHTLITLEFDFRRLHHNAQTFHVYQHALRAGQSE
jgi:hypothetical protein